jgi:pimeloyl-ACP methyl ester carboxylesterase
MIDAPHRSFVLVHGAWHGAWVWKDVLLRLRALGHTATAPTLTGLGERRHTGNDTADLETHVEDVVSHIEMEDLRNVTLVGWSYGGMVATGVLARMAERIASLVYLDAFAPEDGQTLGDLAPAHKAHFDEFMRSGKPLPPIPLAFFGVTDPAMVAFIEPRLTRQPWRTFYQPVKALKPRPAIPTSYIVCTKYGPSPFQGRLAEMTADPAMRVITIDTGHHCMMTAVDETIAALVAG